MQRDLEKSVFVSQSFEKLYQHFKEEIFRSKNPLEPKLVVVPSQRIKDWLQFRLSEDDGVTMGLQFMGLSHAIEMILQEPLLPQTAQLSLKIDGILARMMEENHPELQGYIQDLNHPQGQRRLRRLSDCLADLILTYERFGGDFLGRWSKESGWIQAIYHEVIATRLAARLQKAHRVMEPMQLHFFGISFMPKIYFEFFSRLKNPVKVLAYQLSYCQIFWGDIFRSDDDNNPLLANWGGMGKHILQWLDDPRWKMKECYLGAKNQNLLQRVQQAILSSESTLASGTCDGSIEICTASSKLREVQIVKESLIHILNCSDEDISLSDVSVYAPDMSAYAPFVNQVFQGSPFPFVIDDESSKNEWIDALCALIQLGKGRFEKEEVFSFFSFTCVQKQCRLYMDDVLQLMKWAECGAVRWGFDHKSREKALKLPGLKSQMVEVSERGTWSFALEGLVLGLAAVESDSIIDEIWPLDFVEFSQSELLGEWIVRLDKLHRDLQELKINRSLDDWKVFLKQLTENYLGHELRDSHLFLKEIDRLGKDDKTLFSFDAIWERLQPVLLNSSGFKQSHEMRAIRFSSLKTGRAVPAKITWVMGMSDDAFPRAFNPNPLSEMQGGDPFPSHADEDRYLMLEILMQTSEKWVLSYVNCSLQDGKAQGPNILIEDLKEFCGDRIRHVEHSAQPFDPRYFSKTFPYPSYDAAHYEACKQVEHEPSHLFPQFFGKTIKPTGLVEQDLEIDIKELEQFAKHPLAYFIKHQLGVYLEYQEDQSQEFQLSKLDQIKMSSRGDWIRREENKGHLPLGQFKDVALQANLLKCLAHEKSMSSFDVDANDVFSIQLDRSNVKPLYMGDQKWICPAIAIELEDDKTVWIKGEISNLTAQGVLVDGKDSISEIIKWWPIGLVADFAAKNWGIGKGDFLFLKNQKRIAMPDSDFTEFVKYFMRARTEASPMLPVWGQALLNQNEKELTKAIQASFASSERFFDPYLHWAFSFDRHPDAHHIIENWSQEIKRVYRGLDARAV